MASVSLQHVGKVYDRGSAAVRDLTLQIADGEFLVLLGPSGSGKSTVLRMIAGLEAPSSGQIALDGVDVTGLPPQRRDIAMMFQSYALYPHMTVRENLSFGLRMRRVPAAAIAARVAAVATALGIDALLDRRPAQLSGGERQRVALGRAVVREPRAFLFDEPLSNLDPQLRVSTRTELALLHRRLHATMIYVTHDQEEALTLGTRIAIMRGGRIEQVGAPMDIFDRPANRFVASFVGTPAMNFIPCEVEAGVIEPALRCGAAVIPGPRPERIVAGRRVVVGIRPHDIMLAGGEPPHLTGRVEVRQTLGSSAVVHVRAAGTGDLLVRVVIPADAHAPEGDTVGLRVRADRLHYFDASDGRRLS